MGKKFRFIKKNVSCSGFKTGSDTFFSFAQNEMLPSRTGKNDLQPETVLSLLGSRVFLKIRTKTDITFLLRICYYNW